jgi:hypothetical protein
VLLQSSTAAHKFFYERRTETFYHSYTQTTQRENSLCTDKDLKYHSDTITINSGNMFKSKSFPSDLSAPASPLELGTVWMMIYFLLPLVSSRLRRFTFNLIQKRILNTIKALLLRKKGRTHSVAEEVIEDIISLDEDLPNIVFAPTVASCRENCDAIKKNITQYLDNNTDLTNGELKAAPEFIKSLERDLQNFNLAVQTVACGKKNLAKVELTDVCDFFGEVANRAILN